jgi:hypothetical protein
MTRLQTLRFPLLFLSFLALPIAGFAQDEEPSGDDDSEPADDDDGGGSIPTEDEEKAEAERQRREDIDSDAPKEEPRPQKKSRRKVREVVKGAYLKVNLGPHFWLPPISSVTSTSGTEVDFSFGYDVVDRLPFTLAVELSFVQLITNGQGLNDELTYQALLANGIAPVIQGDFRVIGGTAALRLGPNFGGKKVKRASFMVQLGGGAGYSPALVKFDDLNISGRIANNGYRYIMQGRVLGIIAPGLGIEYYTKLSHFSVGLDVGSNIILGGPVPAISAGLEVFVKYTF